MARDRVTISLPGSLLTDVEELITKTQYSTVSEYIRELIRQDLDNHANRQLAWARIHADQTPTQQRADQPRPMFHLTNWPGPAD